MQSRSLIARWKRVAFDTTRNVSCVFVLPTGHLLEKNIYPSFYFKIISPQFERKKAEHDFKYELIICQSLGLINPNIKKPSRLRVEDWLRCIYREPAVT